MKKALLKISQNTQESVYDVSIKFRALTNIFSYYYNSGSIIQPSVMTKDISVRGIDSTFKKVAATEGNFTFSYSSIKQKKYSCVPFFCCKTFRFMEVILLKKRKLLNPSTTDVTVRYKPINTFTEQIH